MLHVDVDRIAAGKDAADRYPFVAAHLAACWPCGGDLAGPFSPMPTAIRATWAGRPDVPATRTIDALAGLSG